MNEVRFNNIESRLAAMEAQLQSPRAREPCPPPDWATMVESPNTLEEPISPVQSSEPRWDTHVSESTTQAVGFARERFDLPPLNQVYSLAEEYFTGPNQAMPIFDKPSFMDMLNSWCRDPSTQDEASWASINVVLALASLHSLALGSENRARDCLHKAESVINLLVTREDDLKGIQVLLGLVTLFLSTSHPQPTCVLIATAVKLAHRLRLHDREGREAASPERHEQMDRLFWITYILDREISLRAIEPYAQDEDDFDVPLPEVRSQGSSGRDLELQEPEAHYLPLRVQLAHIQSLTYRSTFSVKTRKLSLGQRQLAAEHIDSLLERWRYSMPPRLLPETIFDEEAESTEPQTDMILLHLTACHTQFMAHRIHARDAEWIARLTEYSDRFESPAGNEASNIFSSYTAPVNPSVLLIPEWDRFVQMARLCIRLLRTIESMGNKTFWSTTCVYQTSLIILIANNLTVAEHKVYDNVDSDTELIDTAMQTLQERTAQQAHDESLNVLVKVQLSCAKLHQRAKIATRGRM